MKHFRILILFLSSLLVLNSCSKTSGGGEDKPVVQAAIAIDREALTVSPSGVKTQLQLKASHRWVAVSDDWISLSKSGGDGYTGYQFIDVTVDKNPSNSTRKGSIEFSMPEVNKSIRVLVTQEGEVAATSIADFRKKAVNETEWYILRGTITSIEGTDYGNFYLKDETGEILVYGMTSTKLGTNDHSFEKLGLNEGDVLTLCSLRSEYHGEAQAGGNKIPAYYISHEKGTTPAPVYRDTKASSTTAGWMELPATSDSDGLILLCHGMKIGSKPFRNYSAYYDQENFVSSWVAYPLERKSIGYGKRKDAWGLDPLLDEDIQPYIINISYKPGNGGDYVRGHQLPSGDRTSIEANLKTFYGINMTPQNSTFNGGVWVNLEEKVRAWAKDTETDTVYVVTGCVTKGSETFVYDERGHKVTVPVGYYKTVLRLSKGEYTANAFYFEHKPNTDTDIKKYSISVDELEEKTGVDFFVNLPTAVGEAKAKAIEAADPASEAFWWN